MKRVQVERRAVIVSGLVPKHGRPRLWAFGYADLAKWLGVSEAVVRQRVRAKTLDPADLESLHRARLARPLPVQEAAHETCTA